MTHPSRNILRAVLLAILAAVVFGTAGPAAAKKAPPCWKTLINDWYDGRIDGTYPIHCYREALKHLPTDVETYSSARDDIKQALQERITQSHKPGAGSGGAAGTGGGTGGTNGSGGTPSGPGSNSGSGGTNSGGGGTSPGGDKNTSGPIGDAFNSTKPGSADSVPIPLIVLGAVALLLMAAGGAGFLARRMRTRKLQLASAATLPQRPGAPPPKQP